MKFLNMYDGSISPGEHSFSFVFVLSSTDAQKKAQGEVKIDIQPGENNAVLKTIEDESGTLSTNLALD